MYLSTTEIDVLEEIGKQPQTTAQLANALNKHPSQIRRATNTLAQYQLATRNNGAVTPKTNTHTQLILELILDKPTTKELFTNSMLPILTELLSPKTIQEIIDATSYKKSTVYRQIQHAQKRSLIKTVEDKYVLNKQLWPKMTNVLTQIHLYESHIDSRIPTGAKIYHKTPKEIVFSTPKEHDATKTAFSAYEKHGIKLLLLTNYYYLPKKEIAKRDILKHSLHICKQDKDIRHIIFTALFYLKYKQELTDEQDELLDKIRRTLNGEKFKQFPSKEEIASRAEVYSIPI